MLMVNLNHLLFLFAQFFAVYLHQLEEKTPTNVVRGYLRREHALIKPYQGSGPEVPYWSFGRATLVTDKYIRLTPDRLSQHGVLWNTVPVAFRDWEVVLTVKIHGSTGDLFGDGMAFWYAKEPDSLGMTSGVFGYKNYFDGLGIFIDTYSNHNGPHNHAHPYISAMVNNGSVPYDHDMDGTHTQLGGSEKGCTARLRNKQHETSLLIRYVDDTISVYLDIDDKKLWRECFVVPDVKLPTGYFFGLTAATGDLSDNHDVIAFKTYELEVTRVEKEKDVDRGKIVPQAKVVEAPRDHVEGPKPSRLSGLGTTVAVIFALIGVAAVVIVGVLVLQKRQESSRKRFY